MVGDFTTTIQAMQGRRWIFWIEVQVVKAGTAAEGVAGLVLQDPNRLRRRWISQKTALPALLRRPGRIESNRMTGLEKKCTLGVGRIVRRI